MTEAFICAYVRTPIGRFGGTLSSVRADDLGAVPLKALMERHPSVDFGAVDDVREEVHENYRTLGAGGGYILCPCHNIQAVTPPENIVALYETGYAEGWL